MTHNLWVIWAKMNPFWMQFNLNFRTRNKKSLRKKKFKNSKTRQKATQLGSERSRKLRGLIYNRLKFKLYISLSNFNDNNVAYAHHVISCFWSSREKSSKILKETSNSFFSLFDLSFHTYRCKISCFIKIWNFKIWITCFGLHTTYMHTPPQPPTHCIYTVDNMRQQKAFPSLFLPKSGTNRGWIIVHGRNSSRPWCPDYFNKIIFTGSHVWQP